jgi:phage baseplate assembly protein W
MATFDTERFGADADVPTDPDARLPKTATGDIRLLSGYANLRRTLERIVSTQPGTLLHRPEWGGGAPGFIELASTPGRRAQLASQIRRSVLQDGRFTDCRVTVEEGVRRDNVGTHPGVTVMISAKVQSEDEWITAIAAVSE